jgi:hypothetical protein
VDSSASDGHLLQLRYASISCLIFQMFNFQSTVTIFIIISNICFFNFKGILTLKFDMHHRNHLYGSSEVLLYANIHKSSISSCNALGRSHFSNSCGVTNQFGFLCVCMCGAF